MAQEDDLRAEDVEIRTKKIEGIILPFEYKEIHSTEY